MLWIIGVILIVAWLVGFVAFHVAVGLFHLILAIGIILIIMHFATRHRAAV